MPLSSVVATFEGLAYGGGDAAILFCMAAQLWSIQYPILRFGTEEQKQLFVVPLMRGELRAAHGAAEPEAGSDIFRLQTRAAPCADGYRLTGTKCYITSAPVADFALILASTAPESHSWGLSAFLVDLNSAGVWRSDNVPKMGLESAQFGEIRLENCFVPATAGWARKARAPPFFHPRLISSAISFWLRLSGSCRGFELSVAYVNERKQRERTIGSFQSVSNRIADMAMRLELGRLLIYHAAALRDSGRSTKHYSPLVKLALSEFYVSSSLDAIRNKGAAGYLQKDHSAINLCDAIGSLFYSGTSDVLRNLIASYAGVMHV